MTSSGWYRGRLLHHRSEPRHLFERDVLLAFADVDAIDAAPDGWLPLVPGWPIGLRRQDHLPDSPRGHPDGTPLSPITLRKSVTDRVRSVLGREPTGPMALLSQPRAFGFTFDPVSFIYCFDKDGLEAVVVEVTNTPWGERHVYVLTGGEEEPGGSLLFTSPKLLHVSPFFEMDHEYEFRFSKPAAALRGSIRNFRAGKSVFEVGFALERLCDLGEPMRLPILRHAWMPYETIVGIYGHAALLAWKGAPFQPHPRKYSVGHEPELQAPNLRDPE